MEATILQFDKDQFATLYRQTARSVHDALPFGMKDEFDIEMIAYILELDDKCQSSFTITKNDDYFFSDDKKQIEKLSFIIDEMNQKGYFPSYSDILKILEIEKVQLFSLGIDVKNVA